MTNGSLITNLGKNMVLYRGYTPNASLSATSNLAPSQFKVAINALDPLSTDTSITTVIPITNGTVNDNGSNVLIGSQGGSNSSPNTSTYKEGAGEVDNTAQNLLTNTTDLQKHWTINSLTNSITSTHYVGFWLYIKDTTTLAKFISSGLCMEVRIGNDNSNFKFKDYTAADFSVGWNFMNLGIVGNLSTTGTPASPYTYFHFYIITNNATDSFSTGDIVYDLLRSWQDSDTVKDLTSVTFNTTDKSVTMTAEIAASEANGFLLNGCGIFNKDSTPKVTDKAKYTEESKSSTDTIQFIFVNRIN